MDPVIEGALQTPDGYWLVEVVRYGRHERWYRVTHGATVVGEKVSIGTARAMLGDAYADLVPVEAGRAAHRPGIA
jgi:hypothetical protein